jgi:hypothetical protein
MRATTRIAALVSRQSLAARSVGMTLPKPFVLPACLLSSSGKPAPDGFWATAVDDFRRERQAMKGMGMFQSMKHILVRFGVLGIVVYDVFFILSAGGIYAAASMVRVAGPGGAVGM